MELPPPVELVSRQEVGRAWSGHLTRPELLVTPSTTACAWYNAARDLEVAAWGPGRSPASVVLPERTGWDSHDHLTLGVDREGALHLCGLMHAGPLVSYRTDASGEIGSFAPIRTMVGRDEGCMSYPRFLHGPGGRLLFTYRDGVPGRAVQRFNAYDEERRTWRRLLEVPLLDGEGRRSAYPVGPELGPDGWFHLVWVWRDSTDAATNHTVSYARSPDLARWQNAAGDPLDVPLTAASDAVVDPVGPGGGVINSNTRVGFDAEHRPVIAYHKHDEAGRTQLHNARFEADGWNVVPATEWGSRWEFGGTGTLEYEIEVDGLQHVGGGLLVQPYVHRLEGGRGALRIDAETLRGEPLPPGSAAPFPPELDAPQGPDPGLAVRWRAAVDLRAPAAGAPLVRLALRWESLDAHRDVSRESWPPASAVEVVGVRGGVALAPRR